MKLRNSVILSVGILALSLGLSGAGSASVVKHKELGASLRAFGHTSSVLTRIAFNDFEQPCLQNSPCNPDPTDPGYSPADPTDPDLTPTDPNDPTEPYVEPTDPNDPSSPDFKPCDCQIDDPTNPYLVPDQAPNL